MYISLGWELQFVDATTDQTLFHHMVLDSTRRIVADSCWSLFIFFGVSLGELRRYQMVA